MDKFKIGKSLNISLKIGLGYLVFGLLWIFFSDKFLESFAFSIDTLSTLQTYKGFFFVIISTLFIVGAMFLANNVLRNKLSSLEDFFELNINPVLVLGYFDFEIVRVNKAFYEIFGYPTDAKINITDLVVSEEKFSIKQLKKELSVVRSEKEKKIKWVFKNKDNSTLEVLVTAKSAFCKNRDVIILFLEKIENIETRLSAKKAFLENTFEHIPVGIHILKKEEEKYVSLYSNIEAVRILELEEITEKELMQIQFSDKDRGEISFENLPFIKILNEESKYFDGEVNIIHKDKTLDILLRSSAVTDQEGKTIACVSVFRDVTCIKKTESAYKNYQAKYRTLFETSPEAILIFNAETKEIVDFNKKALYLFKLKPNEIIEKSFDALNPVNQSGGINSSEKIERYINAVVQGGTPHFEWQHKNKYDELISCEVSMAKLPSDEGDFVKCTIVDISDRNLAEDMLNKTEKIYQEVISSVTNNITVHDASNGLLLEGNKTFFETFLYEQENVKNKSITDIYSSNQKYDENSFAEKIKLAKENKELRFRWKSLTKEGKDIWLDLLLKYIEIDGEGRIVAISRNVNEIVVVQQELVALTKSLKEKNEEFRHLLYTATHDLRTPLLNILGFSNELKLNHEELASLMENEENFDFDKFQELLSSDCHNDIDTIVENTKKMSTLINGLIEISRIETFEIKKEDINVFLLIGEIKKNLEHKIEETGVEIIVENLPICFSDKYKLHLIFRNLIDNAIKFRNPEAKSVVKITGKIEDEKLFYSVEDNGIGIEQKNMSKIIEMFYRNDPEYAEGAGLGLSIVEKSLETIGGDLFIESTRGEGSRFTISIPNFFRG